MSDALWITEQDVVQLMDLNDAIGALENEQGCRGNQPERPLTRMLARSTSRRIGPGLLTPAEN